MGDIVIKWIGEYCAGTLSENDARELRRWLDTSPENRDAFCKTVGNIRIYNALASAERITGSFGEIVRRRDKSRRRRSLFLRATAAAAIGAVIIILCARWPERQNGLSDDRIPPGTTKATLVLADGRSIDLAGENLNDLAGLYDGFSIDSSQGTLRYDADIQENNYEYGSSGSIPHSIIVPAGGEYRLTLADGTKVWLNSETRLTFPNRFDDRTRNVFLIGEACFEVAEDRKRPFIVEFGDAKLQVTGTRFSIMAYPECSRARVTLEEGGLNVGYNGMEMELIPGTQALIDKKNGTLISHQVDTHLYTAWTEGVFEFEDMRLYEIARQLSRWYDVEFRFTSAAAENSRFTGVLIKYGDLNEALVMIEKTSNIGFVIEGHTITVAAQR